MNMLQKKFYFVILTHHYNWKYEILENHITYFPTNAQSLLMYIQL